MIEKKVSVVLTSYNHAKYLREAIESVLNQTFYDFELIIWDDGSTDDSWEIIQSYSDLRIRAFHNETGKSGWSFRKAILEVGNVEYVAIHHSDDIWEAQKLEKQVAFLDDNQDIGAVFCNAYIIGENGEPFSDKNHSYYSIFDQPNRGRHEWLNLFFNHGNALCHPSVLIRKKCYEDCGYYRFGFTQIGDMDMWVRLCLKYEIHVLPEKLMRYRVRSNEMNLSGKRPGAHTRGQFEYLQVLNNYRKLSSFEEFIKIFPTAQKYLISGVFDFEFALGMMSLESTPRKARVLFGLMILFESISDPVKAKKIEDLYGFNHSDFIALTAKYDVFSVRSVSSLAAQLEEREQLIQKLMLETAAAEQALLTLNIQMAEIKRSGAWKIASIIRNAHLKLISCIKAVINRVFLLKKLWEYVQSFRNVKLVRTSDLFNESWYVKNNPDVVNAKMNPIFHYINYGGFEGRDPSPYFSSGWYLDTYDDVKNAGINPLLHYLKYGRKEERKIQTRRGGKQLRNEREIKDSAMFYRRISMRNIVHALDRRTQPPPSEQGLVSPAQTLRQQIHRGDIYEGFPHQDFPLDVQGWNSDVPIFRQLIEELKPHYVIELGTWKGASALHMCSLAKELGLDPFILICVDTWLGGTWHWQNSSSDAYPSLGCHHGYPTIYFQFLANVIKTGNTDLIIPFPNTTDVGASFFRSIGIKDIDLIYIDASHTFDAVYTDICDWWSFLRSGGILFGDDFTPSYPGVEQAVRLFCQENTLTFDIADNKWVVRKP